MQSALMNDLGKVRRQQTEQSHFGLRSETVEPGFTRKVRSARADIQRSSFRIDGRKCHQSNSDLRFTRKIPQILFSWVWFAQFHNYIESDRFKYEFFCYIHDFHKKKL